MNCCILVVAKAYHITVYFKKDWIQFANSIPIAFHILSKVNSFWPEYMENFCGKDCEF